MIIIQILYVLWCLIEAKLEKIIIDLKDASLPNYDKLNQQEHTWSAIYYVWSVFITCFIVGNYITLPLCLLLIRRIFFQEGLNLLRNKGLFYLSDKGTDGFAKRLLGKYAGQIVTLVCLGLLIFLNT